MRKYVVLEKPVDSVKKVMIYESNEGVVVFLYNTDEDKSCSADQWYEGIQDASDYCIEQFNINEKDWILIDDPNDGCQHDLIKCE
ncbi:hypothetical protein [Paenibacillus radicis (ex Xue et al. 2023)]|uniref:Uncharacterized protein n=1 Tax=Paenibacillus radicis (ex Xue et al. 2023) TaxID=2972489 RepID=A0ABT1YEP4_9BACL|nr:hypothetical protein [Paenibacillus radicis (ex Xue et al. 2023)]MCR8630884.1 hypothetical protein [Paenibacillus radicis (ex Xue et al. 2023)]